jgi:hypothetical protein
VISEKRQYSKDSSTSSILLELEIREFTVVLREATRNVRKIQLIRIPADF